MRWLVVGVAVGGRSGGSEDIAGMPVPMKRLLMKSWKFIEKA